MKKILKIKNIKNEDLILDDNIDKNLKIILEENAKISIIEIFKTSAKIKREFVLEKNSKLNYTKIQVLPRNSNLECEYTNVLKKKAKLKLNILEYSSKNSYNKIFTNLNKNKSKININILNKLNNNSFVQTEVKTEHKAKNTYANVFCKTILNDTSKAEFSPLSIVKKEARKTQTYQYSKALLLSNDCNVLVKPHLEILNDDLLAKHGSSIGFIDEESLFYLQNKGINFKNASNMLIKAFENEIYAKINEKKSIEFIKKFIRSVDV